MTTVEFSSDELLLVHHALSAFLADFGHDQGSVRHDLHGLLQKIPAPVSA